MIRSKIIVRDMRKLDKIGRTISIQNLQCSTWNKNERGGRGKPQPPKDYRRISRPSKPTAKPTIGMARTITVKAGFSVIVVRILPSHVTVCVKNVPMLVRNALIADTPSPIMVGPVGACLLSYYFICSMPVRTKKPESLQRT